MTRLLSSAFEAVGFHPAEAAGRANLFEQVGQCWGQVIASPPTIAYHVPGRIEVLGKHTDYAGGRSLVCATEQGLAVLASPRADDELRVVDARSSETRIVRIDAGVPPVRGDWANYPTTVGRRLASDFGALHGADLAFASDIPFAAGVSSSSAIVVAVALVLIEINRLRERPEFAAAIPTPEALGGYLGALENGRPFGPLQGGGGVGTMGGSQDQTAILASRPDALTQVRFDPVALERVVPWPDDLTFAIAASGVVAEKTGAAIEHYNGLARMTRRLAELAGGLDQTLGARLIDAGAAPVIAERLRALPDRAEAARLQARLVQLDAECRFIIPGVVDALARGDRSRLGELVAASQQGAVVGLQNQIPETIQLVDLALQLGAVAASAFGAGFGGSVWAIVTAAEGQRFADRWRESYLERFPSHAGSARVFLTRPAAPAVRLPS